MTLRERGVYPDFEPAPAQPAACIDCKELQLDADRRAVEADLVRLVVLHGPERVFAMEGFSRRELGRAMTIMQRHAYSLHCLMHDDADSYDRARDERLEHLTLAAERTAA